MFTKQILFKRIAPALLITTLIISFVFYKIENNHQSSINNYNFNLNDTNGDYFSGNALIGKPSIVFFGFLNCPDVCPSSLQLLSNLIEDLGPSANKINFYFVTVDPDRDQLNLIKDFLSSFHKNIIGVSGQHDELKKLYSAFNIYVKKVKLNNEQYTIDHTAALMILNKQGQKVGELLHENFSEFIVLDNYGKIQLPKEKVSENLKKLIKIR
jgi:protein SCO1/2